MYYFGSSYYFKTLLTRIIIIKNGMEDKIMEKIRLSNILDKHLEVAYIISGEKIPDKYITPLYACMEEVWNLAVDKCNENATTRTIPGPGHMIRINENSILQVKEIITATHMWS